jgi:hypothetical protein
MTINLSVWAMLAASVLYLSSLRPLMDAFPRPFDLVFTLHFSDLTETFLDLFHIVNSILFQPLNSLFVVIVLIAPMHESITPLL